MRRTTLALMLAALAATALAAQAPRPSMIVEGRSTDASAAGQTTTAHGLQAINDAAAAAVIGALQTRFSGQRVEFRLGQVRSERVSLRDLALHGSGQVRFDSSAAWLPMRFDAVYDSATRVVESPAIVLGVGTAASSTRAMPVDGLQAEVARRMAEEFVSQTVGFDFVDTSIVGGDGRRVIVNGNGVARFDQSETAPVRVQAVYDRVSKRWIDASYEFNTIENARLVASH